MINKEVEKKINYLIQAEDQDLVSWDENGNVINTQYLKDIKAYIEKLEKDLEVLEILRPYFSELQDGYLIDEMFLGGKDACEEAKEEFRKIREWLENE